MPDVCRANGFTEILTPDRPGHGVALAPGAERKYRAG